VDNDVNLAAMGELWFGAGQNTQNMVMVAIGTGIGAGIVIDGALYRGASEASGEIGNMLPGGEFLGKNFQDFGALESVASGTGIADQARLALSHQRTAEELDNLTAEDVFEAAKHGQAWARTIIDQTVDYLAIAIANLAVAFDPELIILGGGVRVLPKCWLSRSCIVLKGDPGAPRLVVSSLGLKAGVMGCNCQ
jgi:predicted NBD/HSP70 family sugar kinase